MPTLYTPASTSLRSSGAVRRREDAQRRAATRARIVLLLLDVSTSLSTACSGTANSCAAVRGAAAAREREQEHAGFGANVNRCGRPSPQERTLIERPGPHAHVHSAQQHLLELLPDALLMDGLAAYVSRSSWQSLPLPPAPLPR
jgi:hypothetical protein